MPEPKLEEVFKRGGVPSFTFVQPKEYSHLLVSLRTPGRSVVVEGPSGIGKTSAVQTALKELALAGTTTNLSARKREDIEYIEHLPHMRGAGIVMVDDFQKLPDNVRDHLSDYVKVLADEEIRDTKLVLIGINNCGQNLINVARDIASRIEVIKFENNPDDKVRDLLLKGEEALNIQIDVKDDIIAESQGSFYIAQMMGYEICLKAGVLERQPEKRNAQVSFEGVRAIVWDNLGKQFRRRCEIFCRGTRFRREGRAPYLQVLHWLSTGGEWTLSIRDAIRSHPELRGSVGQIVEKGFLSTLISSDFELQEVLNYDDKYDEVTVEDPQFLFYIRNIPWKSFARQLGYTDVEFKNRYDFALSFAGADRREAEAIFRHLQEREVEVFYDRNEQHRIVAEDIEEYLQPIYQSEARFVVCLLGKEYPDRIWTKVESDAFRDRMTKGEVIPILFNDVPVGMFDSARRRGGFVFERSEGIESQAGEVVDLLCRKLIDVRASRSEAEAV